MNTNTKKLSSERFKEIIEDFEDDGYPTRREIKGLFNHIAAQDEELKASKESWITEQKTIQWLNEKLANVGRERDQLQRSNAEVREEFHEFIVMVDRYGKHLLGTGNKLEEEIARLKLKYFTEFLSSTPTTSDFVVLRKGDKPQ